MQTNSIYDTKAAARRDRPKLALDDGCGFDRILVVQALLLPLRVGIASWPMANDIQIFGCQPAKQPIGVLACTNCLGLGIKPRSASKFPAAEI
ncbi:MAG: hypothetical protein EA001_09820 [Oscillatoriales cyanobacterium]|nr:MAG: hypothetical protein EA001_09820 [Oscillatoriales cyanobacterium]